MAWIAPIAVASKKSREDREEHELIGRLQREDPENRFEYKVLRSYSFAFASEARMQQALREEGRAGWELSAKLDSNRLVLRRKISRRMQDSLLPPELRPYRTEVDSNMPLMIVMLVLGLLTLGLVLGFFGLGALAPIELPWVAISFGIGLLLILGTVGVLAWAARRRS